MKETELRELIKASGKRGVVTYKGKDKRTQFDESVTDKKMQNFKAFIGDKIDEVAKILQK